MGIVETQSEKLNGYGYRFFPHLLQGEGFFFLHVLEKKENSVILIIFHHPKNQRSFSTIK